MFQSYHSSINTVENSRVRALMLSFNPTIVRLILKNENSPKNKLTFQSYHSSINTFQPDDGKYRSSLFQSYHSSINTCRC